MAPLTLASRLFSALARRVAVERLNYPLVLSPGPINLEVIYSLHQYIGQG